MISRTGISHRSHRRGITSGAAAAVTAVIAAAAAIASSGTANAVVNGTDAPPGAYPATVALLDLKNVERGAPVVFGDDRDLQKCGGSLRDPWHVITAAHCLQLSNLPDLRVDAGRTDLSDTGHGQRVAVKAAATHPRYVGDNSDTENRYDIAVLTLAAPIRGIPPVHLVRPGDMSVTTPGVSLQAAGWGFTAASRSARPARLQHATLPVVDDTACAAAHADQDIAFDAPTMVCAGGAGSTLCVADSGSPVYGHRYGHLVQVGITSWGSIDCVPDKPTVFVQLDQPDINHFARTADPRLSSTLVP